MVRIYGLDANYDGLNKLHTVSVYGGFKCKFSISDSPKTRGLSPKTFAELYEKLKLVSDGEEIVLVTWGGPELEALNNSKRVHGNTEDLSIVDIEPLVDYLLPYSSLARVSKLLGVSKNKYNKNPMYDARFIYEIYTLIASGDNRVRFSLDLMSLANPRFNWTFNMAYYFDICSKLNLQLVMDDYIAIASSICRRSDRDKQYQTYLTSLVNSGTDDTDKFSELYYGIKMFKTGCPANARIQTLSCVTALSGFSGKKSLHMLTLKRYPTLVANGKNNIQIHA